MRKLIFGTILGCFLSTAVVAEEGIIRVKSAHSVSATTDRLENVLVAKGMTVFARIDHAAGAKKAGKTLLPTELLVFGNPKIGTSLMLCSRSIAIDLPQKALIWEDASGDTWISYNDPQFLKQRHGTKGCDEVFKKITTAVGNFTKKAAAAQ